MKRRGGKIVAIVSAVVMLFSAVPFQAEAVAGTIYESEGNNTYTNADITDDDYNNYGAITSSSDVDWWKITYSTGGMVNIWMGNIPTGCDYDLYAYREDYEGMFFNTACASSVRKSGNQEFMRIKVYAGESILVQVKSAGGFSSSQYLFRFKLYPQGDMKFFNYSLYTDEQEDAMLTGQGIVESFELCDYSANYYLNETATTIFNELPNTGVTFLLGHGLPGYMSAGSWTKFAAGYNEEFLNSGINMNDYAATELSNNNLIVFAGCYTGASDKVMGNLVTRALSKGAHCCFGWKDEVIQLQMHDWLFSFSQYLVSGYNVEEAMMESDLQMWDLVDPDDPEEIAIFDRETGTSENNSYIVG